MDIRSNQHFLVMQLPRAILVFAHSSETPTPLTVATVVSTLVGIDKILLPPEQIELPAKGLQQSVLVISQDQISRLAVARLQGFRGGVLILAAESFPVLKNKYRILCWGEGSHDACQFPWTLADAMKRITQLVPLEPENLKMLQQELKAPDRWLQRRAIPCLKRLEKQQGGVVQESNLKRYQERQEAIASLADLIAELRAETPVACHAVVEIGGRSAQIQQHFHILLEEMRQSQFQDDSQTALLRQVFAKWRDLVLNAGEGLGVFS